MPRCLRITDVWCGSFLRRCISCRRSTSPQRRQSPSGPGRCGCAPSCVGAHCSLPASAALLSQHGTTSHTATHPRWGLRDPEVETCAEHWHEAGASWCRQSEPQPGPKPPLLSSLLPTDTADSKRRPAATPGCSVRGERSSSAPAVNSSDRFRPTRRTFCSPAASAFQKHNQHLFSCSFKAENWHEKRLAQQRTEFSVQDW